MVKRLTLRLRLRIDAMTNRPALHHDERMSSVLAVNRCRETQNVFRRRGVDRRLERFGCDGVAFVNDDLSVFADARIDLALPRQ